MSGLFNRALERAGRLGLRHRLLRERARSVERPPLVIVPGPFGSVLEDERGRTLFGAPLRLFAGDDFVTSSPLAPAGLLHDFPIVPRLVHYDVFGGLVRYLERVGGYVRGETLFELAFDWRLGVEAGARALEQRLLGLRGSSEQRFDVLAISGGASIVRACLGATGAEIVRRVVYLGAPQRGAYLCFSHLEQGFSLIDASRHHRPEDVASLPGSFDLLPHPDDVVFVREDGTPSGHDLYDPLAWRELGLALAHLPELGERLASARALHRALDAAPAPSDVVVIASRDRLTPKRVIVRGGRARLPSCCPVDDPRTHVPGDGGVDAETAARAPGASSDDVWWIDRGSDSHVALIRDASVRPIVLEALLRSARAPRRDLYPLSSRAAQ